MVHGARTYYVRVTMYICVSASNRRADKVRYKYLTQLPSIHTSIYSLALLQVTSYLTACCCTPANSLIAILN